MEDKKIEIVKATRFTLICKELEMLLERKNRNYGDAVFFPPYLIPQFGRFGAVLVRMSDKIKRLGNLASKNDTDAVGESLRDTLLDLAGYAIIGAMILDDNEQSKKAPW